MLGGNCMSRAPASNDESKSLSAAGGQTFSPEGLGEPFQVPSIRNNPRTEVKAIDESRILTRVMGHDYVVSRHHFTHGRKSKKYENSELRLSAPDQMHSAIARHLPWSHDRAVIVDFQGIGTLLNRRALVFSDKIARTLPFSLGLLDRRDIHLRIGVAGARPSPTNPGGEVVECSWIRGWDLGGYSYSRAGHLPPGTHFSEVTRLSRAGRKELREERTVYSHTAWLGPCANHPSDAPRILKFVPQADGRSLLDALMVWSQESNVRAFAAQIAAWAPQGQGLTIKGRVLRQFPKQKVAAENEMQTLGCEQIFNLDTAQVAYFFGTYWPRVEPDWEDLTGRPYERRGHFHGFLSGRSSRQQHQGFHVRDVFVSAGVQCEVLITPARVALRAEPVSLAGGVITSRATGKTIPI
jgi:hypothetical protein